MIFFSPLFLFSVFCAAFFRCMGQSNRMCVCVHVSNDEFNAYTTNYHSTKAYFILLVQWLFYHIFVVRAIFSNALSTCYFHIRWRWSSAAKLMLGLIFSFLLFICHVLLPKTAHWLRSLQFGFTVLAFWSPIFSFHFRLIMERSI